MVDHGALRGLRGDPPGTGPGDRPRRPQGERVLLEAVVDAREHGLQPVVSGMGMRSDLEWSRVLSMVPTADVTFRMLAEAGEACYWLYSGTVAPAGVVPGAGQKVAITLTWHPAGTVAGGPGNVSHYLGNEPRERISPALPPWTRVLTVLLSER